MNAEQVFGIANQFAIVCWILLLGSLFWARLRIGTQWLGTIGVPVIIGVTYVVALSINYPSPEGGFGSIADVRLLFASDWALLAGWIHYLVFDYFVGAWIVRDSQRNNVHPIPVLPCLFFCFMVGPLGLLLYLAVKSVRQLMATTA